MLRSHWIAGVDEAGCGPLAGPVTAASVVLPKDYLNSEINDSKVLTPEVRERLFDEIRRVAIEYVIVSVGHHRIDRLNIRQATILAQTLVIERLHARMAMRFNTHEKKRRTSMRSVHFLVDGHLPLRTTCSYETIIQGDGKVPVIGAASILAKVTRDRLMEQLDRRYPNYGFLKHKGYGTKIHREAIASHGPCPVHRKTFAGVREHVATRHAANEIQAELDGLSRAAG